MLDSRQKEWIRTVFNNIPNNCESVKDLKLARDINGKGAKEYWDYSNTTEIWKLADHHSIPDNMLVIEYDNKDKEKNYENCRKVVEFLKEQNIPHIIADHSGRSPHIYVFFKVNPEVLVGDITYRTLRVIFFDWIHAKTKIKTNEGSEVNFSPLSYDSSGELIGGHLIRAIGGRYFKNGIVTYHSAFSEIPKLDECVTEYKEVRFPEKIILWEVSEKQFEDIRKTLWEKKEKSGNNDEQEVSFLENDGILYEEVCDPKGCRFAVWDGEKVSYVDEIKVEDEIFVPINDEGITEGAVLLPSRAEEYGNLDSLIQELRGHIHRYLDVSEEFETFAVYYILLSWIYDKVNTLPYLRALGDTGTGKSRFLDVIGRLCYKSCIVSGSITPAPIYRMIRKWHGTIILDEADFRDSNEKNEVVTILNCGFERGRPVIRCQKDRPDELQFLPTFCPKVLSTRYTFKDKALESRCLTERLKETSRKDIPPLLPTEFYKKEQELRNKLLMFRFRYRDKINPNVIAELDLGDVEPRLKQATASFAVLFSNIPELVEKFRKFLWKYNQELIEERSTTFEGMIVNTIFSFKERGLEDISSSDIAFELEKEGVKATPQKVGRHLKTLGVNTDQRRIDGVKRRYVIWNNQLMDVLRKRYVPEESHTNGTNGNMVQGCPKFPSGTSVLKDSAKAFQIVREVIELRCTSSEDGLAEQDNIILDAMEKGIPPDLTEDIIKDLKTKGIVYEPKHGKIGLVDCMNLGTTETEKWVKSMLDNQFKHEEIIVLARKHGLDLELVEKLFEKYRGDEIGEKIP